MISPIQYLWSNSLVRRSLIGIVVIYLVIGIAGFFLLPSYLKSMLVDRLSTELGRTVTVERVSLNPYLLAAEIGPVKILDKDGATTLFAFERLYVNAELISIIKGGPVLSELRLDKPVVTIIRNRDESYNFSDLIEKHFRKPDEAEKAASGKTVFSLNNIQITNGSIDFVDGPKKMTHTIRDLTLQIPFLSTLPYHADTFIEPLLDAVVNDTRVVFRGRTKPFTDSLETQFDIKIKGFSLPLHLAYLPFRPDFNLSKGSIDADTKLTYVQYRDRNPSLGLTGSIDVRDVVLDDLSRKPLLRLQHFGFVLASSDLMAKQFHFAKIAVEGPEVHVARDRTGRLLLPTGSGGPAENPVGNAGKGREVSAPAGSAPVVLIDELSLQQGKLVYDDELRIGMLSSVLDVSRLIIRQIRVDAGKREALLGEVLADGGTVSVRRAENDDAAMHTVAVQPDQHVASKPAPDAPWLVTLSKIGIERYAVRFDDEVPSEPVSLRADDIRFAGTDLSTGKNVQGKAVLQGTVNKRGTVNLEGSVSLEPLAAKLRVDVRGFDLAPFRVYSEDALTVIVTGGRVGTSGMITINRMKEGLNVRYQGRAAVTKFSSIDKVNAEDFLRFDSLTFNAMDISTNPVRVMIKEIALTDFYSRFIINEDGTLNTQGVVEPARPAEEGVVASPSADNQPVRASSVDAGDQDRLAELQSMRAQKLVKIDTVTAQGGTIHFSDRHIKPGFSAELQEIGGRVSGLTSEDDQFADVELRGVMDGGAPLEITGKINPLRENLFVELKADFKNMDLSKTSPYAGRHIGYTIQKGKLSLGMQYVIVNKKLEAKNDVFIDQLTLGEAVESPEATRMPVKLAIALLKNRSGEIQLDLPVEGTTDDPDFRVGKIVWKVILNLLVKAATSPFALLGAIFGGGSGEEMSYVDFEYGRAVVSEQEQKKIDKVLTILHERPALKVDIEGHADLLHDREGLKQEYVRRKVNAQKMRDVESDDGNVDPAKVTVSADEYPKYLKRAYKAEKFPKPSNFLGMAKDIPVAEMEKLMVTHAQVTDEMLRELALERGRAVHAYMTKSKRIEQERIFLLVPRSVAPEKKDKIRDSRVDFKLK